MKKSTFTRKTGATKKRVGFAAEDDQPLEASPVLPIDPDDHQPFPLAGVRFSVFTKEPVVGFGHVTLDGIFGGGIGLGSLFVLQEDINTTFYRTLVSLFMAQALTTPHLPSDSLSSPAQAVCLVSADPVSAWLPLPKPIKDFSGDSDIEKKEEVSPPRSLIPRYARTENSAPGVSCFSFERNSRSPGDTNVISE